MDFIQVYNKFAGMSSKEKLTYRVQVVWWFLLLAVSAVYVELIDKDKQYLFLFKSYGVYLSLVSVGCVLFSIWMYARRQFSVYGLIANLFVGAVLILGFYLLM